MDASAASGATAAPMFIQPRAIISSVPPMIIPVFHIAENGAADQRTGDQGTVELKFIKYRLHTRNTRDDEHQHNLEEG